MRRTSGSMRYWRVIGMASFKPILLISWLVPLLLLTGCAGKMPLFGVDAPSPVVCETPPKITSRQTREIRYGYDQWPDEAVTSLVESLDWLAIRVTQVVDAGGDPVPVIDAHLEELSDYLTGEGRHVRMTMTGNQYKAVAVAYGAVRASASEWKAIAEHWLACIERHNAAESLKTEDLKNGRESD